MTRQKLRQTLLLACLAAFIALHCSAAVLLHAKAVFPTTPCTDTHPPPWPRPQKWNGRLERWLGRK